MSYSFGWWDFVENGSETEMVCRDSNERIVMVGSLAEPWLAKAMAEHPERPADRWMRFEYRHEEFWFPLIVNWVPEEGRILVDYNLSSELWRIETNAETEYPPYGGWIRVDDMVPDAFWCWPGSFFDNTFDSKEVAKDDWGICLIGKWHGGKWEKQYFSRECSCSGYWEVDEGHTSTFAETSLAGGEINRQFIGSGSFQFRFLGCHKSRQDLKRNFSYSIDSMPNQSWMYMFDSTANIQDRIDSLGGRLRISEPDSHNQNRSSSLDRYLAKFPGYWPYLVRSDGKAVITISDEYDDYIQASLFSFMVEERLVLKGYEFGCSSLLLKKSNLQNYWQGIFLNLVESTFDLNEYGKFAPNIGTRSVGGWGIDLDIAYLPKLMREIGNAMQEWNGIDCSLLSFDTNPFCDVQSKQQEFISERFGKFRHLLGRDELYQMMGVLAGIGCMHRHRQLRQY